jgi:integrase
VIQKKTGRPVQFEITEQARRLAGRFRHPPRSIPVSEPFSAAAASLDTTVRPHVHRWVECAGLDSSAYGTHSLRRTKAAQIYRKTGNLRAVQLLLGHTKLESTVRYLGIEVDDALTISEQVEL